MTRAAQAALLAALFAVAPLAAQPIVAEGGVVNAASFLRSGVPGSAVAPGSIISIFGENLGPDESPPLELPLGTTLGGVSVEISTVDGGVLNARPLFVSPTQINAVLSRATPIGEHELRVVRDGVRSAAVRFKVVRTSFGIFTTPLFGFPVAAGADLDHPTAPGGVMTIWGAGLEPFTDRDDVVPAARVESPADIEVYIGGLRAGIVFQGPAPGFVGLDQINVRVPADAPSGCFTPIWVVAEGALFSNVAVAPIGAEGPCQTSTGLSPDVSGRSARLIVTRLADEGFDVRDEAFLRLAAPAPGETVGVDEAFLGDDPALLPPTGVCVPASTPLGFLAWDADAGANLSLRGPPGEFSLTRRSSAVLTTMPPLNLQPGEYEVASEGGADFGPFTAEFTVPEVPDLSVSTAAGEIVASAAGAPDPASVGFSAIVGAFDPRIPGNPNRLVWADRISLADLFVCRLDPDQPEFRVPEAFWANSAVREILIRRIDFGPPADIAFADGEASGLAFGRAVAGRAADLGAVKLPSTRVLLPGGAKIQAEIATSASEQQRGLMNRARLDPGRGMLFLFRESSFLSFWMKDTLIPLDVVFLDSDRRIVEIFADRQPCPENGPCPSFGPTRPTRFVLEVAGGEAARLGLRAGDRLDW